MGRPVIEFHPSARSVGGTIPVRARMRDTTGHPVGYDTSRSAVDIPVGADLVAAAWNMPGNDRIYMPESVAIQRYLDSKGVDVRDLIDEFMAGQRVGATTVDRWLTNTGLRPLFSPVVEDGLRLGMNRIAQQWRQLVAREIPVDNTTYEWYYFDNGTGGNLSPSGREAFRMLRVAEAAPVPVARVTVSGKSVTLFQKGRGIEWTDQSKRAPIDLASLWFQQVGLDIGWGYHDEVIDVLLNGVFADNTDDAPTIAAAAADGTTITDADLYTAQATHRLVYGRSPDVMVMSIARSVAIQVMENGAGQRVFPNGVQAAGLPPIVVADTVPADKVVFVDTGFAVIRLVEREFGTEFDRVPQNGIEGTYGRSTDRFVTFMPDARLILDA